MSSIPRVEGWTNPYAAMSTMASITINRYGVEAEKVLSEALLSLGHEAGKPIVETGAIKKGASLQDWYAIEGNFLKLTDIRDWEVAENTRGKYVIKVKSCPHLEAYK